MDLYKELARLRCFSYADMVQLCGSEKAADWQIKTYLNRGYIKYSTKFIFPRTKMFVLFLMTDYSIRHFQIQVL